MSDQTDAEEPGIDGGERPEEDLGGPDLLDDADGEPSDDDGTGEDGLGGPDLA